MKVTADHDACIGSGQCVPLAPDVFDQDDDGIVILKRTELEESDVTGVKAAVRICPARALTIQEGPK